MSVFIAIYVVRLFDRLIKPDWSSSVLHVLLRRKGEFLQSLMCHSLIYITAKCHKVSTDLFKSFTTITYGVRLLANAA